MLEAAVKSGFSLLWEAACRQLSVLQMISDAVAADSFARAGLIGAVACTLILISLALHQVSLLHRKYMVTAQ
jgi:hypothetical protein